MAVLNLPHHVHPSQKPRQYSMLFFHSASFPQSDRWLGPVPLTFFNPATTAWGHAFIIFWWQHTLYFPCLESGILFSPLPMLECPLKVPYPRLGSPRAPHCWSVLSMVLVLQPFLYVLLPCCLTGRNVPSTLSSLYVLVSLPQYSPCLHRASSIFPFSVQFQLHPLEEIFEEITSNSSLDLVPLSLASLCLYILPALTYRHLLSCQISSPVLSQSKVKTVTGSSLNP